LLNLGHYHWVCHPCNIVRFLLGLLCHVLQQLLCSPKWLFPCVQIVCTPEFCHCTHSAYTLRLNLFLHKKNKCTCIPFHLMVCRLHPVVAFQDMTDHNFLSCIYAYLFSKGTRRIHRHSALPFLGKHSKKFRRFLQAVHIY